MSRKTIFVMGMGRSGTSTVAGVLKNLGVEWGPEHLMMVASSDNVRGFWEFKPLHEINVELLRRLGGDWHSPPSLPKGWELRPDLEYLRNRAKEVIDVCFHTDLWGFKDPRCCLTFPFWPTVVDNNIDCVFVFRNPLEVAYSLFRRDGIPIEKGAALWLRNVAESLVSTKGLRRHFVFYEDLVNGPTGEVARLAEFVGSSGGSAKIKQAVDFVSSDLRHERASIQGLLQHEGLPPTVKSSYAAMRQFLVGQGKSLDQGLEFVVKLLRQESTSTSIS